MALSKFYGWGPDVIAGMTQYQVDYYIRGMTGEKEGKQTFATLAEYQRWERSLQKGKE